MTKTVKKKFKIKGMHCSSCAMTIDFDIEDLAGVKSCKTSFIKQEVEVEYEEGKLNDLQIIQTIEKNGYGAFLISKTSISSD